MDNIRTLALLCENRQPLPEPLAAYVAYSLHSYLNRSAPSLDAAFAVQNYRGGVSSRVEASNWVRDHAVRKLASELAGLSVSAKADRIHQLSLRYAASRWRFDRERAEMPDDYRGAASEPLYEAFRSGARMPLCARQLRNILAR